MNLAIFLTHVTWQKCPRNLKKPLITLVALPTDNRPFFLIKMASYSCQWMVSIHSSSFTHIWFINAEWLWAVSWR